MFGAISGNANAFIPYSLFDKADKYSVAFVKTGLSSLALKPNTIISLYGTLITYHNQESVVMPALVEGMDYAIYVCADKSIRADTSFTAPAGYTTTNSRLVGGFHYSAIPASTTLASGQFATSGQPFVWSQSMLDDIKGINKYSIWDLHFRPRADDPRGMVYIKAINKWVDIYFTNTSSDVLGTSRHGSNIASGTVLPLIPLSEGGNGVTAYTRFSWYEACAIAAAAGKYLMTENDFSRAALGTTENAGLGGASETPLAAQFEPRFTSIYGLHQTTGVMYSWGAEHGTRDVGATADSWGWRNVTGGYGQIYTNTATSEVRQLLGGARTHGGYSGSRAAYWSYYPWHSAWHIGLRAASDHLQLA